MDIETIAWGSIISVCMTVGASLVVARVVARDDARIGRVTHKGIPLRGMKYE